MNSKDVRPAENLTIDTVLKQVPEIDVFRYYLGDVEPYEYFRNPLRKDNKPTAMIYEREEGRLVFRDYAGFFWGDCFDLVMRQEKCNFPQALNFVWHHIPKNKDKAARRYGAVGFVKSIHVKSRPFNKADLTFWAKFNITQETLEHFYVKPIDILWFNNTYDSNRVYKFKNNYDPAYGYYLGGDNWEVYFPSRDKRNKHRTNKPLGKGLLQLPKGPIDKLVITKSMKDVMAFHTVKQLAVALPSEAIMLPEDIMKKLIEKSNDLCILLDYDNTGIHMTWKTRKKYPSIQPLFIRDKLWARGLGYKGAKDFSDIIDLHGVESAINYFKNG